MKNHVPNVDLLRPFQLERSHLRGRLVRLGGTVDYVLKAHDYPAAVSDLLGQLLVLAGALAGGLKFDGRFSLQIRADGPVRLLVADCTNGGEMRGYASFDAERVAELADDEPPMALLGGGLLALTVDQRASGGEVSQGIVELGGDTLADCMLNYFHRSEQVRTGIRVAVGRDPVTDRWHAGAIVMQALPAPDQRQLPEAEDDWRRAMVLLGTASDEELLDPLLRPDDLLFRLFHEDGVRVFTPLALNPGCGCDEERVWNMLQSFPLDDLEGMRQEDGGITVTCQFCSRVYRFDQDRLEALLTPRRH
ncbi:MAG TPA: Hsp33 family molecular chaperone HslO [Geminicoccaceae bacterium]|nr:Hsp33 family molecular chaperone HslO [Geminicoccaceae bacterium]